MFSRLPKASAAPGSDTAKGVDQRIIDEIMGRQSTGPSGLAVGERLGVK
jgi:hypothetical protein